MGLEEFYKQFCELHTQEEVLLTTDFEKIIINTADQEYCNLRTLKLNNLVRFLNPKVQVECIDFPSINESEDLPDDLDFDDIQGMMKDDDPKYRELLVSEENKLLFFLPSHIESRIKNITCNNQTRNIDARLQSVLPQKFIESKDLKFKNPKVEQTMIGYLDRSEHSLSFYKFFNNCEDKECSFDETQEKIQYVKHVMNLDFVESYQKYFIGNIDELIS